MTRRRRRPVVDHAVAALLGGIVALYVVAVLAIPVAAISWVVSAVR